MHIEHSHDTKYYMKEGDKRVVVQSVTEEKDLGVYFTSDLKHRKTLSQICCKSEINPSNGTNKD